MNLMSAFCAVVLCLGISSLTHAQVKKYAVAELKAQGGVEKSVAALIATEICNKLFEIHDTAEQALASF